MDPVTTMRTATANLLRMGMTDERSTYGNSGNPISAPASQWKESPQAHDPVAFGLSIVNPCFSMVSTKSITAPPR